MKKAIIILSALLLIFGISAYAEGDDIQIVIDGELLKTDTPAMNLFSRVLVPMRGIFETLGAEVTWDDGAKTVWARREDQFVSIDTLHGTMGTGVYNSDGLPYWVENIELDVPAQLMFDRTYVPIRAVSEALGAFVAWDGSMNRVYIDSRPDEGGLVYYASDSDYQKLYCVRKNGQSRYKLSDRSVKDLELYDDMVYYLDKNTSCLYRTAAGADEELLVGTAVYKVAVDDGWVYYQELENGVKKSGILYRMNVYTKEVQRLTDVSVRYAEKYRDYIYFNTFTDNNLYALYKDGSYLSTIDTGDSVYSKLYPFNCIFYGDYILIEDGVWFGNLMRCDLDGANMISLTRLNAFVEKNQQHNAWVIYKQPDNGQDIYCVHIDGWDNHLVHKGDPSWLDITLLAQWDDMVYYKHPMRNEVYRASLDGTIDEYVGYANSMQVYDGRLFIEFNGVYVGNADGSGMQKLYGKNVKGFAVKDDVVYCKDDVTSRLYMTDFNGRGGYITCDCCGAWVATDY